MSDPQEVSHAAPTRRATTLTPVSAALAVMCCLFWAGAYVTGKLAIGTPDAPGFGPFRAAFFRFAIAGAVLGAWGLCRNRASLRVQKRDWPAFGRVALLGMGLTYVFNYQGLALSTGTAAALIMATEPVWIAVLAVLFLRERVTPPRLFGIVAGLTGAMLVVLSTQKSGASPSAGASAMLGNVLMVLSLLWESGAVLTAKKLTARYKGRTILTYEFLLGALLLAPFAIWETIQTGSLHPTRAAWWSFGYLVTACTLVAYVVWFWLLETTDASELTVFIFLQPVVGTLMGVALFGDPFTLVTLSGAILVLAGLAGLTWQTKGRPTPADSPLDNPVPEAFAP